MREIRCRAKSKISNEFVYGHFAQIQGGPHIIMGGALVPVFPETVGQFTGLTDKNGKQIFEGDVVNLWWVQRTLENKGKSPKYKAVIEFGNPNHYYSWGWQLKMIDDMPFNSDILLWVSMEEHGAFCEIIGNIHDNPPLLRHEGA